tara:strand:+ start:108 stop:245 length:138 start_codon:yes stop_codon:yes gene_type:complete
MTMASKKKRQAPALTPAAIQAANNRARSESIRKDHKQALKKAKFE